jgi:hypothetical protein
MVRDTRRLPFAGVCPSSQAHGRAFVSVEDEEGDFRCVYAPYLLQDGAVSLPRDYVAPLEIDVGQIVGFTPVEPAIKKPRGSRKKSAPHAPGTNGAAAAPRKPAPRAKS